MIDFRSDTLSLPTEGMLETILSAKLGDDGRTDERGRGEDECCNELEDYAADLLNKEEAILFSSGTLANTTAILSYCKPHDKVLVDRITHVYKSEKVVFDPDFGQLEPVFYDVDEQCRPDLKSLEKHFQNEKIKLLILENTHNFHSGLILTPEYMSKIWDLAQKYNVKIHLDGARLFNAAVALNRPAADFVRYVDSVMFCLSKGLGAPLGSLLVSSHENCKKFRAKRKLLGGAMRQCGVMAAPGLFALKNQVERLAEDHRRAGILIDGIQDLRYVKVPPKVDSNIVVLAMAENGISPKEYCTLAEEFGLLIKPVLDNSVRLVFYIGIDDQATEKTIEILHQMDEAIAKRR